MPKFVFKVSFPVTQYTHIYASDEAAAREKIESDLIDELDEILGAPDDISEVKIELLPQE